MITARSLALTFGTRREVPAHSKKSDKLRKYTFIYFKCIQHAEKALGYFFIAKNANFLEFSWGNKKECNLKKSNERQISQILGFWKIYIPIESIE